MSLTLYSKPASFLQGEVDIPGDKSLSHRALLLAAISEGTTHIRGFLPSKDCLATKNALLAMGVRIEMQEEIQVHGVGRRGLQAPTHPLDCGNSGTTMRLLAGVLAGQSFATQLIGDESLSLRPMERIVIPLRQMGAKIEARQGKAPLHLYPSDLKGITYLLPEASAQVKSCILLAGLYAKGASTVIEPMQTRDHTENLLAQFGFSIQRAARRSTVFPDKEGQADILNLPKDLSSAAFFILAATLMPHSHLFLPGIGVNPTRTGILSLLQQMGASIHLSNYQWLGKEPIADITVKSARLQGIHIKKEWVPLAIDEFPLLFIAAAFAKGKTFIEGAKELRFKESNRIAVMVEGLQQLGINAKAKEDGAIIEGRELQAGVVDSRGDHRVAMAFAIAGALSRGGIEIQHCENIATSFPNFVATANKIGMIIEEK